MAGLISRSSRPRQNGALSRIAVACLRWTQASLLSAMLCALTACNKAPEVVSSTKSPTPEERRTIADQLLKNEVASGRMTVGEANQKRQIVDTMLKVEATGDFTPITRPIRKWDGSDEVPNPLTGEERHIFEKNEDAKAVQTGRMSFEEANRKRRVFAALKVAETTGDVAPVAREYETDEARAGLTIAGLTFDEQKSFEDWRNWFLLKRGRMSPDEFQRKRRVLEEGTFRLTPEEGEALREKLYQRSIQSGQLTAEQADRQRKVVGDLKEAGASGDPARIFAAAQALLSMQRETSAKNGDVASVQGMDEAIHELGDAKAQTSRLLLDLRHKRPGLTGSFEEIREKLPPKSALVSFVEHVAEVGPVYFAAVVSKNAEIAWIPLGAGSNINAAIVGYRKTMTSGSGVSDETATKILSELAERIWKPIQQSLPTDLESVFLSPEGNLNLVSFATLIVDGQFLGEKIRLRYLSAPKSLSRTFHRTNGPVVIVADPAHDLPASRAPRIGTPPVVVTAQLKSLKLLGLSKTRNESTNLQATCRARGLTDVQRLHGTEATESAFRRVQSPFLVHFGVHGYYHHGVLDPVSGPAVMGDLLPQSVVRNANQSWLFLSGASSTIRAWLDGRVPDPENDGILTADEVEALDLKATWLVTLASCDSGFGLPLSGEGVSGMRQAFMTAGVQNLLVALWPVTSDSTVSFMKEFYDEALESMDAPGTLAKVQGRLLRSWRQDARIGTAQAARSAGAFVVCSPGF